jgi:hypothetical protein
MKYLFGINSHRDLLLRNKIVELVDYDIFADFTEIYNGFLSHKKQAAPKSAPENYRALLVKTYLKRHLLTVGQTVHIATPTSTVWLCNAREINSTATFRYDLKKSQIMRELAYVILKRKLY